MPVLKHESGRRELVPRHRDFVDRFFDDLPDMFRRPVLFWPERALDQLRVEEFRENGSIVMRVESPGIDPDKDLEITVQDNVLHLAVERHEEEKSEGRDYIHRELRYGAFERDLALPKGVSEKEIKASYRDGIVEIRIPFPKETAEAATKISVAKQS